MTIRHTFCICVALAALGACGRTRHADHTITNVISCPVMSAAPGDAVCSLQSMSGSQVAGVVRFHIQDGALVITASVTGLRPGGKHAIHIHEFGDLRAADGSSAGGHFNPGGHEHGGPSAKQHHAGDLGNLSADGAGEAHYELQVEGLTITEILGRSLVVHANEDDLTSQPAGKAGPRIAVGVIGLAQPAE